MSFLFANSGDYRNPSLDEQFERALASVRRMAQDYAAAQNKALLADLATAIAERDRLESQLRELRNALERIHELCADDNWDADEVREFVQFHLAATTHPARSSADDCA